MCQEWKEQTVDHKFTCMLQGISVKFMESSPIFPFTITDEYPGNSPKFSGVYLTYYVGENLLYGDHVSPSKKPTSLRGNVWNKCLSSPVHRGKIKKAKDLQEKDFMVRFMIVDIEEYALSIEGLLKKYHNLCGTIWKWSYLLVTVATKRTVGTNIILMRIRQQENSS